MPCLQDADETVFWPGSLRAADVDVRRRALDACVRLQPEALAEHSGETVLCLQVLTWRLAAVH